MSGGGGDWNDDALLSSSISPPASKVKVRALLLPSSCQTAKKRQEEKLFFDCSYCFQPHPGASLCLLRQDGAFLRFSLACLARTCWLIFDDV